MGIFMHACVWMCGYVNAIFVQLRLSSLSFCVFLFAGFLDASVLDRQYNDLGLVGLRSLHLPPLTFISSAAYLKEAAAALLQSAQPLLVVVKPNAVAEAQKRGGVAAAALVGTVTDQSLLKALGDLPSSAEVNDVVDMETPVFSSTGTSLARVAQTLELHRFVLVQSEAGLVYAAVEAKGLLHTFFGSQKNGRIPE